MQSAFSPKLLMAFGLSIWLAAPAAAETSADLSDRIGRLERSVAHAQSDLQVAQAYNMPPADIPGGGYDGGGQDVAALGVRIDRLENQMRTLNGQIEQAQFDIRRLDDQLRKFQQDVDFRFQGNGGRGGGGGPAVPPAPGQRRGEIDDQMMPPAAAPTEQTASRFGAPGAGTRGSDAFNPAADPNAPGVPRIIGTLQPETGFSSAPGTPTIVAAPAAANPGALPQGPLGLDSRDPNAPLNLASAPRTSRPQVYASNPPNSASTGALSTQPLQAAGLEPIPQPGGGRPAGTQMASLPTSTPRDDFETASMALKGEQFETAETGFKNFIDKYPKDRLLPDAIFYLGETYFARNRYRDAAEQYLKISSDYSKAAKAPESLLRLGQSLDKLGAKEQACAAFAEVGHKYPSALASVRATAERESKRVQC
jgi:tol-pal system protein YbgF